MFAKMNLKNACSSVKKAINRQTKKTNVAPLSQNAPLAPPCPVDLCEPSTSKAGSIETRPGQDTGCGFVPKSFFLDGKLTMEVEDYQKFLEHRAGLERTEVDVKALLKKVFPGIKIWTTGSLPAEVDLHSSDLDMSIKIPSLDGPTGDKLLAVKAALVGRKEFSKVWVIFARVPILRLVYAPTGVEIDISMDRDDGKRNTQLLAWYGQIDARFSLLCKAVKGWATRVGVEGAAKGRLNSFTLCLMVIQYLQAGVSPAILPPLQELFPELNGEIEVENDDYQQRNLRAELEKRGHRFEENKSSVGVLFAGFLKFYADFDFEQNWISVRHGRVMPKTWDENKEPMNGMPQCATYIVVADPFIAPAWNCAGSVKHRSTFERLHHEFQLSLDRLVEHRSIFGGPLESLGRRMIRLEAEERDKKIKVWAAETLEERVEKADEKGEAPLIGGSEDDWQNLPTYDGLEFLPIPFDRYKDNCEFWNLVEKEDTLLAWPDTYIPVF